jgi:hypothetical protein
MLRAEERVVMRHVSSPGTLALLGIAAGCSYAPQPQAKAVPREVVEFPLRATRDLDLLFLVDDSPSMADKQANLADNLPRFIDALGAIPGGLPNVHIGVATSDLGTQGAGDSNPSFGPAVGQIAMGGCSGIGKDGNLQTFGAPVGSDVFLSDIGDPVTGMRTRNYTGALATVFAQMVHAGAGGCGFEQHLEAIKHALLPSNAVNQRFLRPDANLGIIIVADEDDCSLSHYSLLGPEAAALGPQQSFRCTRFGVVCDQHGQTPDEMNVPGPKDQCHPADDSMYLTRVADHAAFLKGLKVDPAKVAVAAIAGTTAPFAVELRPPPRSTAAIPALAHSCTYVGNGGNPEVADPAIRIASLLDQFPARSAFATICQRDLSDALQQFADVLKDMIGIPCLAGPLASAASRTPGTQYDCKVTVAVAEDPTPGTALPRCTSDDASATNQPCWHLAADAMKCPRGDHLTPVIEGADALPSDHYILASCALASVM